MPTAAEQATIVDFQLHRYYKTGLQSQYHRNRGLLVIPVMGPEGTAPIVARVHAPYALRETKFEYVKGGTPPVFPVADDTTAGDTLLTEDLTLPSPTFQGDGLPVYGVAGCYQYVQPLGGRTSQSTFELDQHAVPTPALLIDEHLRTPALTNEIDQILDGVWNRKDVPTATFCSYGMVR